MDKIDYYFKLVVRETHLDWSFQKVEEYIWKSAKYAFGPGIIEGGGVTPTTPDASLAAVVGDLKLVDKQGRYVGKVADTTVNCSVDKDGISTVDDLTAGQGRWLTIGCALSRDNSDPKVDGNGNTVYMYATDSYEVFVVAGAKGGLDGSGVPLADKPSLPGSYESSDDFRPDALILADIKIQQTAQSIISGDIDYTRRENWIRKTGYTYIASDVLVAGTAKEALIQFADWLDAYLGGMATVGFWDNIGANEGQGFADLTTLSAGTTVTINTVFDALIAAYTAKGGAGKIGCTGASVGSGSGTIGLPDGTLQDAVHYLLALVYSESLSRAAVDATKYDKTGGEVSGDIYPDANGIRALGKPTVRFNGIFLKKETKGKTFFASQAQPITVAGVDSGWDFKNNDGEYWESTGGPGPQLVLPINLPTGAIFSDLLIGIGLWGAGVNKSITCTLLSQSAFAKGSTVIATESQTVIDDLDRAFIFTSPILPETTIVTETKYYLVIQGGVGVVFYGASATGEFDQAISL